MSLEAANREVLFDKHYFQGGLKVGGYAHEGYWDYPVHHVTFQHLMARKPTSVLELGAARGYIVKRCHDAGIYAVGGEISEHCLMTAAGEVHKLDMCVTPWTVFDLDMDEKHLNGKFDLCFSIAVLEHIPEQFLPAVIEEMKRHSHRGLHGIDFGEHDDGFDKTHCSLRPKAWWEELFKKHEYPCEVVDKEELEKGSIPQEILQGDGKVKLNIGCGTNMFHYGWLNLDVQDLNEFAQRNGYRFNQHDIRVGFPTLQSQTVDYIAAYNVLGYLTYNETLDFFKSCRRILKTNGILRISVPDAKKLFRDYGVNNFYGGVWDEISMVVEQMPTDISKMWTLFGRGGYSSAYDEKTLLCLLKEAGFEEEKCQRLQWRGGNLQVTKETLNVAPYYDLNGEVTA